MSGARVAVVQFPGVNCESETVRALERVGLEAEVFRWTRPAAELERFDGYVLPGGFSYQDRVRAGALAAKDPLVDRLAAGAERGKPVLGICNGAQVLVESGLVPGGGSVTLALARNRMPGRAGYFSRWITVRVEPSSCVFTRGLEPGTLIPLPVAHGEGRFVSRDSSLLSALARDGQMPFRYVSAAGEEDPPFPDNPNGSEHAAAAVSNPQGNVLAIMPHPERAQDLGQVGRAVAGPWADRRDRALDSGDADAAGRPGPGLLLFDALRRHFEEG
jgi:phosphoribosylformylglycinamidine synthase I